MEPTYERPEPKPILTIPVAILIAGAIVGGAVLWTNKSPSVANVPTQNPGEVVKEVPKVDKDDYIMGNPDADITIIEYSDASCPFCKMFHSTMNKIMQEYGKTGKVAWVYRHFPLENIHPNAKKEGEAMECAGELGGNDAFWSFTNALYETTPSVTSTSPKGLDPMELPKIAEKVGLNKSAFVSCLESGKFAEKVMADFREGADAGVLGTPYSFLITNGGSTTIPLNGAMSYQELKSTIDAILTNI